MHEPPRLRPVGSVPGASRRGECEGGSRWPARQLARGIPTTATARRWQSFGNADGWAVFSLARLRDPAKWLVPHHLPGTLRPRPPPDSSALICFAYLALHCAGSSDSAHSVPFQSATQFKQPRLAKTLAVVPVRQTKPASIRALRSPDLQQIRRQKMAVGKDLSALRGSNRHCIPVLADRARRRRGRGPSSPRDFVRARQAIAASIGPVPPLTLLRRVQADRPDAG